MRAVTRLAALIGFEVGAVVALHGLGRVPWLRVPVADLGTWLAVTPAEDVLMAGTRIVALACGYWLLASTVLYSAAAAARLTAALRVMAPVTLPGVRRLADRAVAVALVASTTVPTLLVPTAPASAQTPGPRAAQDTGPLEPVPPPALPRPDTLPTRAQTPADPPPPDRGAAAAEAGRRADDPSGRDDVVSHEVESGDNLWTITVTHLRAHGEEPDEARVRQVWVTVVESNRDALTSGDPDLIFPGETITLSPPPPPGPATATPGSALHPER